MIKIIKIIILLHNDENAYKLKVSFNTGCSVKKSVFTFITNFRAHQVYYFPYLRSLSFAICNQLLAIC